jgi:hypothetical protein
MKISLKKYSEKSFIKNLYIKRGIIIAKKWLL